MSRPLAPAGGLLRGRGIALMVTMMGQAPQDPGALGVRKVTGVCLPLVLFSLPFSSSLLSFFFYMPFSSTCLRNMRIFFVSTAEAVGSLCGRL